MDSCPVRAEQVLEGHGRPLRTTLSRPSDWAKYEIALDMALHFGPEDHSCAEKLNKNNNQVGRETLQLFKSGLTAQLRTKLRRGRRETTAMTAIRRVPKSTSGGRGEGTEPPGVSCFASGRVCPRPANDNASPHGSRSALCRAGGVVLTLVASVWLVLALP